MKIAQVSQCNMIIKSPVTFQINIIIEICTIVSLQMRKCKKHKMCTWSVFGKNHTWCFGKLYVKPRCIHSFELISVNLNVYTSIDIRILLLTYHRWTSILQVYARVRVFIICSNMGLSHFVVGDLGFGYNPQFLCYLKI